MNEQLHEQALKEIAVQYTNIKALTFQQETRFLNLQEANQDSGGGMPRGFIRESIYKMVVGHIFSVLFGVWSLSKIGIG